MNDRDKAHNDDNASSTMYSRSNLSDVRVVEIADEQAEYCGLLLAGLGADVVKIEPPGGAPTRTIGPFYEDVIDPERSLYFWQYNRGKRSIVLDLDADRETFLDLMATADVFIDTRPRRQTESLDAAELRRRFPHLITVRVTPFGDEGPWADYTASDLVHLALGGPIMNCGYDPQPDGSYDVAPIAPQAWHAYHIAGEQTAMAIISALVHKSRSGDGQALSCAVHEAVAKNTELDLMNWVMRRAPLYRQTCRHAAERISVVPSIHQTKDGRWFSLALVGPRDRSKLIPFLERYGMADGLTSADGSPAGGRAREIPGSGDSTENAARLQEAVQRLFRKFTFETAPWREAQDAGLICVPLRRPHENIDDEHWTKRATFAEVEHPELGQSFTYVSSKWVSDVPWVIGRRAPLIDEDREAILTEMQRPREVSDLIISSPGVRATVPARPARLHPRRRTPMALDGVRILDFTWFLASAGGTRFLAALGAESIKVEWHAHPDTRLGAMAPLGGRRARETTLTPLPGVTDPDMGGQFNNKNAGKRGISLNVRHPRGLEIARELVGISDIVAEGFSPGVLESWGLGFDILKSLRPDIIYAQQSGMGSQGSYGRFRAVGPVAAALAGTSDMSGLPEPAMPAGWGYSYLDWIGAYSFATAMLAALYRREITGEGQHIDASQTETGIYLAGLPILEWSANGRVWQRTGNRSTHKIAAPHSVYRCEGVDRWLAIACFTEDQWRSLVEVADNPDWSTSSMFHDLRSRTANQIVLDSHIEDWTRKQDAYALMHRLQRAGVPAGVCQTAQDRCENDPQLASLSWLVEVTGTKIGTWPVAEVPVKFDGTPTHIGGTHDRGAPCYGEDNEYVYGELLGLTSSEIGKLIDDGVI